MRKCIDCHDTSKIVLTAGLEPRSCRRQGRHSTLNATLSLRRKFCRRLNLLWRRVRVAAPSVTVCVKRQASSVEFKRRVSIVSVSVKRRVSVVSVKRQCPCQRRVIFLSPSSEPPLLWPSSLSSSSHPLLSVDSASLPAASIQRQRQRCQAPASGSASSRVSLLFPSSDPPLR